MGIFSKKKKNTAHADDEMAKAVLTVAGAGAVLVSSIVGMAGLGAYTAFTAVAASSGTALAIGAGFLGLCAGAVVGIPTAAFVMATGAVAYGVLKMGGRAVSALGSAIAKPFQKKAAATPEIAKTAQVPTKAAEPKAEAQKAKPKFEKASASKAKAPKAKPATASKTAAPKA